MGHTASDAKTFMINGPTIMSKMVGESEANMRKTFDEKNAPVVIIIDEIDLIYQSSKKPNAEKISVSQVSFFRKNIL